MKKFAAARKIAVAALTALAVTGGIRDNSNKLLVNIPRFFQISDDSKVRIIDEYNQMLVRRFLGKVKDSYGLGSIIAANGGGAVGLEYLVQEYYQGYHICREFAQKEKFGEADYDKLGRELCSLKAKNSNSVDFSNPDVEKAHEDLAKTQVTHILRLLRADDGAQDYRGLVRKVYTREQYQAYINEHKEKISIVNEEMRKTINPVKRYVLGNSEINRMKKAAMDSYQESVLEIFGP